VKVSQDYPARSALASGRATFVDLGHHTRARVQWREHAWANSRHGIAGWRLGRGAAGSSGDPALAAAAFLGRM